MTISPPRAYPQGNMPHLNIGHLPVAFVFSTPGAKEKSSGRPVTGVTGENLSLALMHLHSELPTVFSSTERYAYRITNAYNWPTAKSLGDKSSQAADRLITTPTNIARVVKEIDGCNVVILCGLKAQLLAEPIRQIGPTVICSWHTSNQALFQKFSTTDVSKLSEPRSRRQLRVKLWAQELLDSLNSARETFLGLHPPA